jgi:hypothetical protein
VFQRLLGGEVGLHQVGLGHREQAVLDAERVQRQQVLGRLRHPALLGRYHEQHRRHRADPGQHVRDEAFVAGYVHERRADRGPRPSTRNRGRS